eukprot:4103199-Prymnesium_polylepis.1
MACEKSMRRIVSRPLRIWLGASSTATAGTHTPVNGSEDECAESSWMPAHPVQSGCECEARSSRRSGGTESPREHLARLGRNEVTLRAGGLDQLEGHVSEEEVGDR